MSSPKVTFFCPRRQNDILITKQRSIKKKLVMDLSFTLSVVSAILAITAVIAVFIVIFRYHNTVTKTHTDNIETNMDENLRIPVTAEVGSGYFKMTDVSFDSDTLGKIKIRNGKSDAQMKEEDADLVITPVEGRALEVTVGRNLTFEGHSRCGTTHQERSTSLVCRWCQRLTHQRPLSVAPTPPPSPPSLLMRMKLAPLCGTTFGAPIAATAGGNLFDVRARHLLWH
ncbi:WSSV123 [White spot syndrome virus]|uniref:WSSV123 n=1 Tax=White spot syndrome virus TaxID=342409 RepID=A0A2I6SBQ3_9VIRU|nr:WSSV123 [White spot syndrome virus]